MELNLGKGYKNFSGKNIEQMPKLIAEGRIPVNISQLMQQRLVSVERHWKHNYFDTGDAFVYHPDGRVKIVLDSQTLRNINPQSHLSNSALILSDDIYDKLQGPEFTRKELAKITERDLFPKETKSHPIWQALARDQSLLNEYVDKISAEMEANLGYSFSMGVCLDQPQNIPTLRAVSIYRLEGRSRLDGGFYLDVEVGNRVGLMPEALTNKK